MRRQIRALLVLTLILGLLVAAAPVQAGSARVKLTVDEGIPNVLEGTIVSSSLPNCATGKVETVNPTSRNIGTEGMQFRGTKVVKCDSGDTLEFRYVATYLRCDSPIDWGRWRVTGGTGIFEDARGGGFLIGQYTGGSSTACDNTGIMDNWFGRVFLN